MASNSSLTAVAENGDIPIAAGALAAGSSRILAACSWECQTDLASVLRLVLEEELSAWDLSGPPQNGENVVVLEGRLHNDNVAPLLLYLHCDPHGPEEIVGLGIVSEARNMEVYIGDEYCATGRGEKVFTIQHDSKNDQVTLYKKYLKLEFSAASCKIKLLSICEKQRVLISKILVQVKSVGTKSGPDVAALGSGIDLCKVQTIMESMGSKLSPGAQQLLDMVRFQQKNGLPFGSKLQNIFGKNGFGFENNHTIDGLKKVADLQRLDHLSNGPYLLKARSATGMVLQDLKMHMGMDKQIPNTCNVLEPPGLQTPQPSALLSQHDFKGLVSSFLQEQGNENPNMPNSMLLLPFLQTVCGQVNRLRIDERNKHFENNSVSEEDGIRTVGVAQQPVCLHLEKIISKSMELMEKRLMDHIDLRMQKLQEHLDNKVAALLDLVQNSNNVSQEHDPSRPECSNGKR
ncbi:LOW QUALITY PROTEIN: ATPase PAAT [Rhineura floridana]|uniref:LOW QUALITY PROTEIN: ATPase PAAT n=1 Tax=Rhineura floridana TaxID=261503 RepID=UPI002AC89040|nr:LOW QUALITY PROTEIN: ATPase PAAT [Rhineura floridana]